MCNLPTPWTPLDPPPPLPMFEADSQNFASAASVPRGFTLQKFWPAVGGDHRGRGVPAKPLSPSNTSLAGGGGGGIAGGP